MNFLNFVILLKLFQEVFGNGPGIVFVELILYQNPSGKTDAGTECDSWFHQLVNDRCDLVFNVCVKDVDVKTSSSMCDVGLLSTLGHIFQDTERVFFDKMIGFIPNPFNFSLKSMPENVRIGLNITDDDADGQELISQLDHTIQLPRIIDGDQTDVAKIVLSSKFSEISFRIYGQCAEHYHGPGCRQYCKPSFSSREGHYACDKVTGEKYCLIGWTGEDCRQRDYCQVENPCHGNSRCFMNGSETSCECPSTLTGRLCDLSVRPCHSSPCFNGGVCVRNNDSYDLQSPKIYCICPLNFTGHSCQEDVNECRDMSSPCDNSATCVNTFGSYYCLCAHNYWGLRCERPPVYSIMSLDGSYLHKQAQSATFSNNVIIILLTIVASLILLIVILSLMYLKKHGFLIMTGHHSDSEASVYSECHYEDINQKDSTVQKSYSDDKETFDNIYEEQMEEDVDGGKMKHICHNVKALSETCI